MRSLNQIKVIVSQLDVLEELKQHFGNVLDYINMLMQKGKSWLEEMDCLTYIEINQYLASGTAECLRRCEYIAGNQDKPCLMDTSSQSEKIVPFSRSPSKKFPGNRLDLSKHLEEFYKVTAAHTKDIEELKRKQRDHENQIENLKQQKEENESQILARMDKIGKETLKGVDFLKYLQTQMESLDNEVKENKKLLHSEICERIVKVEMKQAEQDKKLKGIDKTHDEMKKFLKVNHGEMISGLNEANERLDMLHSECKHCSDKLMETDNRMGDILVSIEAFTQLEATVRRQEELVKMINDNVTNQEGRYVLHQEDVEQKVQTASDLAASLHVHSMSLWSEIRELKKSLEGMYSDDVARNNSEISHEISALEVSTGSCLSCQSLIMDYMEKAIESLNAKVGDLTRKTDKLSTDIKDIRAKDVHVAFCLQVLNRQVHKELKKDKILNCFSCRINLPRTQSSGYSFQTGVFTSPYRGLYLVGLVVENFGGVDLQLNIYQTRNDGAEYFTSQLKVLKNSVASLVVPLTMDRGEQMYIRPNKDYASVMLGECTFLSCILIKTF